MARFRYRLQAALDTFAAEERGARGAHVEACRALDDALRRVAEVDERRATALERLRIAGGVPARELIFADAQLAALERVRAQRMATVAATRRHCAETRAALVTANRRKTALERHRERAHAEFERLAEMREAAELDEGNAARTIRPRSSHARSTIAP